MRYLSVSLLLVILIGVLSSPVRAQESETAIFFTGAHPGGPGDIYRLMDGVTEPHSARTQIFTNATAISGDKKWIAHVTFLGGELYSVREDLIRQLFQAVINPSVPTRMYFTWFPDSSSVIIRVVDEPDMHGLAYGGMLRTTNEFAENWKWIFCERIVQNRRTGEPGLVCGYPQDAPQVEPPDQVVIHWGQEPVPLDSNAYLPLIGRPGEPLPPYAWFRDGEKETIIFYDALPANTRPDFYTVSTGTAIQALLPPDSGRQSEFDVSSDHQQIAVISRSTDAGGQSVDCVRVYNIATGALVWGRQNEACSPAFTDPASGGFSEVAWYPNRNQIVIAGRSPELGAYLRQVNLDSGEDTILLQGYELIENVFVVDVPAQAAQP